MINIISVLIKFLVCLWDAFPPNIVTHFNFLFLLGNSTMPHRLNLFSFPLFPLLILPFSLIPQPSSLRSLTIIACFHTCLKILSRNIWFAKNQNFLPLNSSVLSDSTIPDGESFYWTFTLLLIFRCESANCIFVSLIPIRFKLHSLLLKTLHRYNHLSFLKLA